MSNTQKATILAYLKTGKSISGLRAIRDYGVYRLSDVIFKLRGDGHNIVTDMRTAENGKTYASYTLVR